MLFPELTEENNEPEGRDFNRDLTYDPGMPNTGPRRSVPQFSLRYILILSFFLRIGLPSAASLHGVQLNF
jgi:hypothetical protein